MKIEITSTILPIPILYKRSDILYIKGLYKNLNEPNYIFISDGNGVLTLVSSTGSFNSYDFQYDHKNDLSWANDVFEKYIGSVTLSN